MIQKKKYNFVPIVKFDKIGYTYWQHWWTHPQLPSSSTTEPP